MITKNYLKKILSYNENTGVFTWIKANAAQTKIGDEAGWRHHGGYIAIGINGNAYLAHRLAWFYVYNYWPKEHIDHINHVRDDNRIVNLRESNYKINMKNKSEYKTNRSRVTGVCWHKRDKVWQAKIKTKGRHIYLGGFKDKFEAICARMSANNKHGFHKNHGR